MDHHGLRVCIGLLTISLTLLAPLQSAWSQVAPAITAQPRPGTFPGVAPTVNPSIPRAADPRNAVATVPSLRSSRDYLVQLLRSSRTVDEFRHALEKTVVRSRVERFCLVSGQYPAKAFCTRNMFGILDELSTADQHLVQMGLNDAWDVLGGGEAGGDLVACGGASPGSVTDLLPMRGNGSAGNSAGLTGAAAPDAAGKAPGSGPGTMPDLGRFGGSRGPAGGEAGVDSILGPELNSLIGACRSQQGSRLRAGLGGSLPGNPGWNQAVQSATGAMDAVVGQCRDSKNGMISDPDSDAVKPATPPPPPPAPAKKSAGDALAGVAQTTLSLADTTQAIGEAAGAVEGCSSKAGCVVSVGLAVVGLAADSAGLVTDNETVDQIGTGADIAGGAWALATMNGVAAAGVAEILPAIGVGLAVYAVYEPLVGTPIANAMSSTYARWADSNWEKKYGSGGGARTPAGEGGKPSCSELAAKWNAFKAYCAQPGNNWQTYDCVRFVTRLNGCADPGLVNPVPGEEYTCTAKCADAACKAARRRAACEFTEKQRSMLSIPSGEGAALSCATRFDASLQLQAMVETKLCERAYGDAPGRCGLNAPSGGGSGVAPPAPQGSSPIKPVAPRLPQ